MAIIICAACENSTCNGSSCDKCSEDFKSFRESKISIYEYLSSEEAVVFEKCNFLKRYLLKSLEDGKSNIDWKHLQETGQLSEHTEKLFAEELSGVGN